MRLVTKKIATLQEIATHWDLYDVIRATEWLDMMEDAEYLAVKKAQEK
jgi:hypothetical protein